MLIATLLDHSISSPSHAFTAEDSQSKLLSAAKRLGNRLGRGNMDAAGVQYLSLTSLGVKPISPPKRIHICRGLGAHPFGPTGDEVL